MSSRIIVDQKPHKQTFYAWIKVGIGAIVLCWLIIHVDLEQSYDSLKKIQINWLILTVICIVFSTFLGAFNAFLLLTINSNIKWPLFLSIYWLGWAFSLVTPGQIGDIATMTSLLKKHKIDWHLTLGRGILDKLISFFVTVILATIGLYFVSMQNLSTRIVDFNLLLTIPFFGLIIFLFYSKSFWLSKPRIYNTIDLIKRAFHEAKKTTREHPERIIINLVLSCIKIMLLGTSYWCIFKAMGTDNSDLFKTITFSSISSLIAYIPISFNGIGTVEASGLVLFSQLGVANSIILAGYLTLRTLGITLAWTPSAILLLFYRYK